MCRALSLFSVIQAATDIEASQESPLKLPESKLRFSILIQKGDKMLLHDFNPIFKNAIPFGRDIY
jgi:hypothetical protein